MDFEAFEICENADKIPIYLILFQRKIFSCFPSKTCVQAEQLEDQGLQCSDDDAADNNSATVSDLNEQGFTASCGKRQKIEEWWTEGEKKKK